MLSSQIVDRNSAEMAWYRKGSARKKKKRFYLISDSTGSGRMQPAAPHGTG
jgi:hypothetical protein